MFKFGKQKQNKTSQINAPQHVAIIMDGNSRWAKEKSLPTQFGHKYGSENVSKIVEACIEFGVKYLSIYAFSSENWNRPQDEIKYLMGLLAKYLDNETDNLVTKNIKVLVSGNLEKIEKSLAEKIFKVENLTRNNSAITLNVAFSYGARQEIVDSAKKIALALRNNQIEVSDINEDLFSKNLYHPEIPDPDLLIRTAGDLRLSNFMLWQIAYTEFYFTKSFWPDFDKKELAKAISVFNQRERRYGKR